ncbi:MAG: hypothetical protein SGI86_02915 [Deltaproteobacteria bacterium]|nr:hypothetical protein [Deltaproteobacteria bacterium]
MNRIMYYVCALAMGVAGTMVGCYNPELANKTDLRCAPTGKKCPDTLVCNEVTNFCVAKTTGTGGTGGVGTGGTGGVVVNGGTAGTTRTGGTGGTQAMCIGPLPTASCSVATQTRGICDPVCQRGCACDQRCAISGTEADCVAPRGVIQVGESCNPKVDACRPGAVCLTEWAEAKCGSHCYRNCRVDADCGMGAHCTVDLELQGAVLPVKVCDNAPENCSPIFGKGACGNAQLHPYPSFGCYLMGTDYPDEATCECAGVVKEGEACKYERECLPGHTCIEGANNIGYCRKVCPLLAPVEANTICGGPTFRCASYFGSKQFGYCIAR